MTILDHSKLTDEEIELLRRDVCPDCKSIDGFVPGPRGGAGQNIFCTSCGAGFNVAFPRWVIFGERIRGRQDDRDSARKN